jgi:hypothetical protein
MDKEEGEGTGEVFKDGLTLLKKLKKATWKGRVVCLRQDMSAVGRVVLVEKGKQGKVQVRNLNLGIGLGLGKVQVRNLGLGLD